MKNRVIKFRIWNSQDKFFCSSEFMELNMAGSDFNNLSSFLVFQQFTGLSDKNGRDIYEGDIIEFEIQECSERGEFDDYITKGRFEVKFNKGVFGKEDRWGDMQMMIDGRKGWHWSVDEYKVVGNIFENPELLK